MSHILDWFAIFIFILVATIALERASAWFLDGFQKRGIKISDNACDESLEKRRD